MTKSEFTDWKRHPVTQQVFQALEARKEFYTEMLVMQAADADPRKLVEYATVVKTIVDILQAEPEEDSNGR